MDGIMYEKLNINSTLNFIEKINRQSLTRNLADT